MPATKPLFKSQPAIKEQGFSLIELMAGIVIMAISMAAMTTLIFPMAGKSVDPIYQVRAAELGQSLINEIMGRRFDENPAQSGGLLRCGEVAGIDCSVIGIDAGEFANDPDTFDDVDDYNGYTHDIKKLASVGSYINLYENFTFSVTVVYDDDYNGGSNDTEKLAKRINVTVITPAQGIFKFAAYKGNY
ncbi:MAG: MSHA pilin protein MshD [Alteromonadaceae bacterium]|jgi:MSHA pilin protein MshD